MINAWRHRFARRAVRGLVIAIAASGAISACANKDLVVPKGAFSSKYALQLQMMGLPSQVGASPLYLLTAAFYLGPASTKDDAMRLMTVKWTRVVSGSQTVTLPVDIATCLADNSRQGTKDGCTMYLAAIITPDSFDVAKDTTDDHDPMRSALDYAFPMGPYDVVPGRTPVIPPVDLSLSRFGVVNWQQDNALRLGNGVNPNSAGSIGFPGYAPIAGFGSGTAAPTLFALTQGSTLTPVGLNQQPDGTPYPQLQIFDGTNWRRVVATSAPGKSFFTDVTALAANEVYMSSSAGLYRYDGSAISKVTAVNTDSLYTISSVVNGSARYVVTGGSSGVVWVGNTTSWQRYIMPNNANVTTSCITGPSEAFVASFASGAIYRFDGTSWTATSVPATGSKGDLQCPAPGQAFIINQGGPLLKWNGSGWSTMPTSGLGPSRLIRWGVVSGSEIYAYADSASYDRAFYRFDGSSWKEVGRTRFTQLGSRPWADPRGGAAYVMSPFGRIERVTSTGVTVVAYQPSLRDVSMSSASSAFAVGWNLFLARWDGSRWNVDAPPAGVLGSRLLHSVWSDGPKNAWAVGTGSTILRYDGSWNVVSSTPNPVGGTVAEFNGVWGAGSDVWVAGGNGIVRCKSATACGQEYSGTAMYGVWGSSASNVFAVGAGGAILRYNGSSWSPMQSPTSHLLVRISGSGPNDVWAIGDSVVVHYDGTQWKNVPLSADGRFMRSQAPSSFLQNMFELGIWARGPKEVYIGSDYGMIARYDGTEWREVLPATQFGRRIVAISGALGGCAIALTEGQSDLPAPTMWRGMGPSGCLASSMAPPSIWP